MSFKSILLLLVLSVFSTFAAENDIVGFWKTEKGSAIFSVYKTCGEFVGKIVWLDSAYIDKKNPDESLRSKPILGTTPMKKLTYNIRKNSWENGKVYDAESGKTYSCKITVSSDLEKLFLRGYAGISILGRTSSWTKVKKGSFKENSIENP